MSWVEPFDLEPQISRLFEIIRVIARQPGISFDQILSKMSASWAKPTLLKDLRILKDLGILDERRHRSGYFLSANSFTDDERDLLVTGLWVVANNLRHPVNRQMLKRLLKRLSPSPNENSTLTYPVVSVGNRVIVETTDDRQHDLMAWLQGYILSGQAVQIRQSQDPWRNPHRGWETVFPLQMIFHEIAWYLLVERANGTLAAYRLDRLDPQIRLAEQEPRGLVAQRRSLKKALEHLSYSWNMSVPGLVPVSWT